MTAVDLLNTLQDLSEKEFKLFKWYLKQPGLLEGCRSISASYLENAERWSTVDLMVNAYKIHGALKMTMSVLEMIPRNDLLQSLSDSSSGPEVSGDVRGAAAYSENRRAWSSQTHSKAAGLSAGPGPVLHEPGGVRWLRQDLMKYSCELTVDTNTVDRFIKLSDNNRKLTHVMEVQSYPDHPDRSDGSIQLLCRTGLTGRCYWEVEWEGEVSVSVSYRGISRRGARNDCVFGFNDQSWSLSCSADDGYSVWHNNRQTSIFSSSFSSSGRVSVYVDCPSGTLSFYRVSSDSLIHLHTFNTTFTEPLYPGFGFISTSSSSYSCGSSVSLCSL